MGLAAGKSRKAAHCAAFRRRRQAGARYNRRMSYQVLARKWRPRRFDTLVGQEHVVRALSHALDAQRLHHAYLFTGTRGVGKTTLSRILAKSLNCQGPDGQGGVTSQPCGQCQACTEIDAGRFVDYIEMDAASNRGVEEMTSLLEQAVYAPTSGRYKVYMIDEVHMLSNHAFNAMLKTLEEPPEHVKFILATTDPQKVPVTVLSRCLQFNLKQMSPPAVTEHLQSIMQQEGIEAEPGALRLLGQAAQGSMRDALSLLDQAIAYSGGAVTEEAVRGMLGAIDQTYLVRLLDALAAGDGKALVAIADELAARSIGFAAALGDLATLLSRMALAQAVPDALGDDPLAPEIRRLAEAFDPAEVQLQYSIAVRSRADLGLAPDEYAGFVMALLRMLAFRPGDASAPAQAKPLLAPRAAARASVAAPAGRPVPPAVAEAPATRAVPLATPSVAPPAVPPVTPIAVPAAAPLAADPAAAAALDFDGDWPALTRRLNVRGAAAQLATQSELVAVQDKTFHLRVPVKSLAEGALVERLRAALSECFGQPLRVEVAVGSVSGTTAYAVDQSERAARYAAAEAALRADPFVQEVLQTMGGAIVPGSIKPV
jgi:DNA polymerase-3 subunit gamma/tau